MRFLVFLCALWPCLMGSAFAAELVLQSQYRWTHDDPNFGGFSGLWLSPDGSELIALSDRGYYAKAQVTRDQGQILEIETTEVTQLPLVDNRAPEDFLIDAEGLTVAPDGSIYVSYEGHHRVWKFDATFENPQWTHKWNYFWHLQNNSGLEAIASDKDGVIYAIPERSGKWEKPFPVQRYKDGVWDATLSIPRSKRFLVVGAEFGPDGRFYLLERDFDVLSAFKSRVRRFELMDQEFVGEETLLETRFSAMDNAEGISLWTDTDNRTIVSIISDDNYTGILRTFVTEYVLVE